MRARPYTFVVPILDPSARPAGKSGISWSAGQVQVSKDGGALANATNLPTELGTTGCYALTLTAAEMDALSVFVRFTPTGGDPAYEHLSTNGFPSGSVVSNAGNTAQTFKTDRTEAAGDFWKDSLLLFTTGSLAGQVKRITAYDGSTKFVTLSGALAAAPSAADRFVLVNA